MGTRLWVLLKERHWQTYGTFCREYQKAAKQVDPGLSDSAPARAQFYRWTTGEIKGLPYSDHCLVLEKMFPGWSAAQLFERCEPEPDSVPEEAVPTEAGAAALAYLFRTIDSGLADPDGAPPDWGPPLDVTPRTGTDIAPQLPAAVSSHGVGTSEMTVELGQRLVELAKIRRLPRADLEQLAHLAGNIVDLDTTINIDVTSDGRADLTYRHELLNMSNRPLTRQAKELWFEHTTGKLEITPMSENGRRVAIQRVHDTGNLVKFACQISPPIRPGEAGIIGYSCTGGRFVDDHYWRQAMPRYTRHLTIRLRHRGGGRLAVCTAVEEHPDGSENSATEELMWDYDGDDVVITLTRDYLRPNQAVTLRWAVSNEPA
jgi:hypothetical protein